MSFEPTFDSVSQHQVPEWFHDAKLGIFVHWGLYSVPAFAPNAGELSEILASGDWAKWFTNNPYAEWYMNSYRIDGSPTQQHHRATYGPRFDYAEFGPMFNRAVEQWDPDAWAHLFKGVNARYVVLTTKHHDGFLLWPSQTPNPFIRNYHTRRDLLGELATAVRGQGMSMAYYYSGGIDWTFNPQVVRHITDLGLATPQQAEYVAYANAHWRELIDRYQTAVLWNDIAYPRETNLNELFAEYYNKMPDGLVNNRFTQKFQMGQDGIISDNHYDFATPEYSSFSEIRAKKWESCRGIGASFGYNAQEGPEQYQSVENLVRSLIDIVSKNGNLLLNVGPMADGTIPSLQLERLVGLGQWLDVNGDAIFDTRPWQVAEGKTDGGLDVRFTQKDNTLYATLLARPQATQFVLNDLQATEGATIHLFGQDSPIIWQQREEGILVELAQPLSVAPAYSLQIMPQPQRLS